MYDLVGAFLLDAVRICLMYDFMMSDVNKKIQKLYIRHQTSEIRHQTSDILHPTSISKSL